MGWEDELFEMFDELEHRAAALYDAERAPELADRSRAEYQQVTLASRLMATLDGEVSLDVVGVGRVAGVLTRVGRGWCLVTGAAGADWIVPLAAVAGATGISERSVPEVAWSPLTRLSLASALRRLAESGDRCVVHLVTGARHEGTVRRVGRDFMELVETGGRGALVAFDHLAAAQSWD